MLTESVWMKTGYFLPRTLRNMPTEAGAVWVRRRLLDETDCTFGIVLLRSRGPGEAGAQ